MDSRVYLGGLFVSCDIVEFLEDAYQVGQLSRQFMNNKNSIRINDLY